MAATTGELTIQGATPQANCLVAMVAVTRRGAIANHARAVAGTPHIATGRRHAVCPSGGVSVLTYASRFAVFFDADSVARAVHFVAGRGSHSALQTHAVIPLIAGTDRLVVDHDAASQTAAVHSKTVGDTGQANGPVPRCTFAERPFPGGYALAVARTGLPFAGGISR
jgi:hypothetical protein